MSRLTTASIAANAVLLVLLATRLPSFWSLLPWLIAAMCFMLMVGMARYARRRGGAPFVVLRGRVSCPECAYLLDLDDKHCAKCGYSVAQVKSRVSCPECRARNWEDDVYCRQCGHKMPEPAS